MVHSRQEISSVIVPGYVQEFVTDENKVETSTLVHISMISSTFGTTGNVVRVRLSGQTTDVILSNGVCTLCL